MCIKKSLAVSILTSVAVITFLGTKPALAADAHQHDTNLSHGKYSLQHRYISVEDYNHLEMGVKINKYIGLDLRYAEAGSLYEIRPRATVVFKWKPTTNIGLSYKNYFEYRIVEDKDAAFRYRGKFKVEYKIGSLTPYVSDRFNWTEKQKLYSHELEGGFSFKFNNTFAISAFYRQITDEHFNNKGSLTGSALSFSF